MPDPKAWRLPPPENHQDFEVLCRELTSARLGVELSLYGRSGQAQYGLDFYADLDDGVHGFQCKSGPTLTFKEVEAEVKKADGFPVPLSAYTVLTAADRDARVQDAVLALSVEHRAQGKFSVDVNWWPDIRDRLVEYPKVFRAHYSHLAPGLPDLLQGASRRLDRDFPGSSLEIRSTPGIIGVTVQPGPGGIPLKMTFIGKCAAERFHAGMRSGEEIAFGDGEFKVSMPEALTLVFGSPREGDRSSLELKPSLTGRAFPIQLLIEPRHFHKNLAQFKRWARRHAASIAATLTFLRAGTDVEVVELVPQLLPMALVVERRKTPKGLTLLARGDRQYAGATAAKAVAAEEVIRALEEGAYVGIYIDKKSIAWETASCDGSCQGLKDDLGILAELADKADWDILLPDRIPQEEIRSAASLLELFKTGRRVLALGGTARFKVGSEEQLAGLRGLLTEAIEPLSAVVRQNPGEIELLGAHYWMPATILRLDRVTIPPDCRERILAATELPLTMEIEIPDDVEVVEELAEEEEVA